ncbi:MAG: hypothetical protein GXO79_09550 [Chlorobi bacterium]|nr:hypothetical protein [Chlorobiota bacterium]
MDKKTLLKLINNNIQEIEILLESYSSSYAIPEMEVNLILSKIKVLKDEFAILSDLKMENVVPEPSQKLEKIEEVKHEEQIENEVMTEEKEIPVIEDAAPEPETKEETGLKKPERKRVKKSKLKERKEKKVVTTRADLEKMSPPNEIIEVISAEKPKIEKIEKPISQKKQAKDKSSIMADKFEVTKQSINDLIASSKKTRDLATKLKDAPIANLKKAINLNDKIRFIKELFNGQNEKYQQAVDELNKCKNLDEALEYLNKNYTWNQEKESFRDFLELIYRRFINT